MIQEKKTKSGRLLEVDLYPVWKNGTRIPSRAPKHKRTSAEQERYNRAQAIKKLIRLVNANFDTGDILMHPTYRPEKAPLSEDKARRDIRNYISRVKYKRASELTRVTKLLKENPNSKRLLDKKKQLEKPFKYVYVIEKQTYKTGKLAGRDNYHFHIFLTGGLNRDMLEDMWGADMRVNADRFQPEKFGPESAARYMSKDPQGNKRFCHSQNCEKPKEKKSGVPIMSHRSLSKVAQERVDDADYWQRKHKGYKFLRCYSRFNAYNGHWYVSVIMYKTNSKEELPQWNIEDWIGD